MAARCERGSNSPHHVIGATPRSITCPPSKAGRMTGAPTSGRSATAGRPGVHQSRRATGAGLVYPTLHAKLLSTIREIQARGTVTIVIAEEADEMVRPYADHLIEISAVSTLFHPLLSTIPLQVIATGETQSQI